MQAIFLAAGESKRMKPLTKSKPLIPIMGKPILYHVLTSFQKEVKFDELIIVANPENKGGLVAVAQELGIEPKIVLQSEALGMGDAILRAKDLIEGEVMIINAEDLVEPRLYGEILEKASDDRVEMVIPGLEIKEYFSGGYLEFDGDRLCGLVEKPKQEETPSNIVKLVVDYFRDGKKLVKALEQAHSDQDDVYEKALDSLIKDGIKAEVVLYRGEWYPLKYPWHLLRIMGFMLKNIKGKISPLSSVSDKATVEGEVILEEGVRIFEGAVIKGPCYIGKNTIVGNNSLIRDSVVEEKSVVGYSTEIARSYIGSGSWFHTNYVGDSVIEGDFGMGSGAVVANLRLDNREIKVGAERVETHLNKLGIMVGIGVRMGVNSTSMPGVRIGANSLIGPEVLVDRDIDPHTRITVSQTHQVSTQADQLTSYDAFKEKLK